MPVLAQHSPELAVLLKASLATVHGKLAEAYELRSERWKAVRASGNTRLAMEGRSFAVELSGYLHGTDARQEITALRREAVENRHRLAERVTQVAEVAALAGKLGAGTKGWALLKERREMGGRFPAKLIRAVAFHHAVRRETAPFQRLVDDWKVGFAAEPTSVTTWLLRTWGNEIFGLGLPPVSIDWCEPEETVASRWMETVATGRKRLNLP